MMLPAWRYVGGSGAISLLVVRDGSSWLACLPVRRAARFRKVPGPAMLAWVHTHCFLGTPLVDRDDVVGPLRALLAFVGETRGAATSHSSSSGTTGRSAPGWRSAGGRGHAGDPRRARRAAALRRRADADYLHPDLKAKRRRELQRQRRGWKPARPDQREQPGRRPAAIESSLDLETSGWKGDEGPRSPPPGTGCSSASCAGRWPPTRGCSSSPSKQAITWPR